METLGLLPKATQPHRPRGRSLRLTTELLLMLTWRDIVIKYKQSVMGFFWAILMPCLIVLAGLVVRAGMARMSGVPLATDGMAAILVKSLPWAFFVSAIRFSTNSLASNVNLVTRSNCPRIVFPLASVLSALFDLLVAFVPMLVILLLMGVPLTSAALWAIPLLLLLVALVSGLGILLATANLFYRDVKYLVEVFLTFGIFFTPVIFESDMLGEWKHLILLNPLAPLLEALHKSVVLGQAPADLPWLAYSAAFTGVVLVLSVILFRRLEPIFADRI